MLNQNLMEFLIKLIQIFFQELIDCLIFQNSLLELKFNLKKVLMEKYLPFFLIHLVDVGLCFLIVKDKLILVLDVNKLLFTQDIHFLLINKFKLMSLMMVLHS